MKIKKIAAISLLTASALILFFIESRLPPVAPIPGVKIGLANVMSLAALFLLGGRDAAAVLFLRILLGGVFSGSPTGFFYSLSGGVFCFLIMVLIYKHFSENKIWAVSVFGAVAHNIGQITVAVLLTRTPAVLWYSPVLLISGIISGAFIGIAAQGVIVKLKKLFLFK